MYLLCTFQNDLDGAHIDLGPDGFVIPRQEHLQQVPKFQEHRQHVPKQSHDVLVTSVHRPKGAEAVRAESRQVRFGFVTSVSDLD